MSDVDTERAGEMPEGYINPPLNHVPPLYLDQPTEDDEIAQDITVRPMSIRELRELGFVQEINRLILHPCGMALSVQLHPDGSESLSMVWDCREDPEGVMFGDDYLSPEKAETVARLIEQRGPARIDRTGFVIQPLPADRAQLHLTIREPMVHTSGDAEG